MEERPSTSSLKPLCGDFPMQNTVLEDVAGHLSGAPLKGIEPNQDPTTNVGSTPYPRRARIDPRVNRLPGVSSGAGIFPGLTGAGHSMPGFPGTGHLSPGAGKAELSPGSIGTGNFPGLTGHLARQLPGFSSVPGPTGHSPVTSGAAAFISSHIQAPVPSRSLPILSLRGQSFLGSEMPMDTRETLVSDQQFALRGNSPVPVHSDTGLTGWSIYSGDSGHHICNCA